MPWCACAIVQMAKEKDAPHLSFNIIGPNGGVMPLVFGPVGRETQDATSYALDIAMKHARDMAALYTLRKWHA